MKNSLLITFFVIMTGFLHAQIQDLAKLANGKLVLSNILYDSQDKVYGYIYFFDQGDIDKNNVQMEYVLLDKNLNKVSNSTFTRKKYRKLFYRSFITCSLINNDELLLKFQYTPSNGGLIIDSFCIISIKNKTVSPDYWYKNGNITEVPQGQFEYLKQSSEAYSVGPFFADRKHNAIFILEKWYNKSGSNKFIRYYNTKNELLWSYEYNPVGKNKNFNTADILTISSNDIYLAESKFISKNPNEYKIVVLDPATGKKKYEYILENNQNKYSYILLALKKINNQLILVGNYSLHQKHEDFELKNNLGFYKIVLDENGKELSKKYTPWDEFKNQLEIDQYGRVEKNFQLHPTEFFMFEDGSLSILTEKYKPGKQGIGLPIPIIGVITKLATFSEQKTTDFVLFSLDKDFNNKSVKTIQKDLTKGYSSDYLFSQYIKDNTGVAFFFMDYLKAEKKWILGINTIINGELKEEKIPIFSKDEKYTILPMKAKEGYIILREYNEKEKYNQIRLEKVNF